MTDGKTVRGKDCILFVEECMKRAISRKDAIRLAAEFYDVSENCVRIALWRKAKTSPYRSLKYAFSEEEEKLLMLLSSRKNSKSMMFSTSLNSRSASWIPAGPWIMS